MGPVQLILRFAGTRFGIACERGAVRWLGWSPVGKLYAWLTGAPYNAVLLLTTTGRKTGKARSVVLPYFLCGRSVAVVGSKGGAPTDPHWVRNLRSEPRARIRIRRRPQAVRARIAEGDDREQVWEQITRRAQVYLEYAERAKLHRQIPVVILTPEVAPEPEVGAEPEWLEEL